MRTRHLLPLLLLPILLPAAARANWILYGNAITTAQYHQVLPVVIADGAGGAFIAWADQRSGVLNGDDIYVQRVSGGGDVLWTATGVAVCTATGLQSDPQMVADGAGGVIVTWTDQRNIATTGMDLYAQRLNASGVAQWQTDGVPVCTHDGNQQWQRMISDDDAGALVLWADGRNPYGRDIYIQRIRSTGIMQWMANGDTLCTASQDQYEPLIVSDMAGGGIGIWRDWRNGQHGDIYAQRFNSEGNVEWAPNGISVRGTVLEDVPRAAVSDGAGGAIVISIDANEIHAQRVNTNGVVQWNPIGIALCTHWAGETDPTSVSDGAGGAIVAWKDLRDPPGDIFAQRISGAGSVLWWPTGEWVGALQYAQEKPRAISDGTGGVIVTWQDLRSNSSYDIYAQRLNAAGDAQWIANGVALTTRNATQRNPAIASDGAGGAIVVWEDVREQIGPSFYTDLYARRVSHGGMVITGVEPSTPAFSLELGDAHPNPFSGATTFELRLASASNVSVEIFDVAGRRVRALQLGRRDAGVWPLRFDGHDDHARALPSGVYFYRVRAAGETATRKLVIAR